MSYHSRIPADPEYIKIIGTAFYNFTYLEWIVVWTIFKLANEGTAYKHNDKTAGQLANDFKKYIESSTPPLSRGLFDKLVSFQKAFSDARHTRNELLHAHPYTAQGGLQQLTKEGIQWDMQAVEAAALLFENAAIKGSEIFHGSLKRERP